MHFEIYRQTSGSLAVAVLGGEWRWRLRAKNGEIVASGEGYHNRADCLHAIGLVKQTNPFTPVKDV